MIYSANIKLMSNAAHKAGRRLFRDFGEIENLQVAKKGYLDFVTKSDIAAENIIKETLLSARPEHGFLMEEAGEIESKNQYRWLVDPLDGTTNFIHGFSHFCISIALEETVNDKSEIIAGFIYNPATQESFWAEKGKGAWLEKSGCKEARLRVSSRSKIEESLITTASVRLNENIKGPMDVITSTSAGFRSVGSTALSMAYVATGRFDGFVQGNVKEWDIAAGLIILSEAGGSYCTINGSKDVLKNKNIIAANPRLLPNLQKTFKKLA